MKSNRDSKLSRSMASTDSSCPKTPNSPKMKPGSEKTWPVNKQMSFEQLQTKLTERLQNRGHLNEVKAELRNKLVNDLFDMSSQLNLARHAPLDSETSKLPLQVSHWLICDFLKRESYEFTMSTFLRESQLVSNPETVFTIEDILHIMAVPKNSDLCKDLIKMHRDTKERCFLYHILERLLKEVPFNISKTNAQTNTNFTSNDDRRAFNIKEEYFRKRIDAEIRNRLNLVVAKQKVLDKTIEIDDDEVESIKNPDANIKIPNNEKEADDTLKDESEMVPIKFDKETYLSKLKLAENEVRIATLTEQNRILQNQINSLSDMLGSQSDYTIIKSELQIVKKELAMTTKYFQDMQSKHLELKNLFEAKISELTMGMVTPSSELLQAHQELKKVESAFRQDQEALKHQNIRLSSEVKDLKHNYEKAINRINELKYEISSLSQLNERLQSEIHNMRWLQDEKERQHFRSKSYPNYGTYQAATQYPSNFPLAPIVRGPENRNSYSSSGSSSLKPPSFIQEAKNRLDTMEAEARNLEQTYGRVLENQLQAPTFSSCYPYQLDARLKMARSVPSLNQDVVLIDQQKRQYYASTQELRNTESKRSISPNQDCIHDEQQRNSRRNIKSSSSLDLMCKGHIGEFPLRYTLSPKPLDKKTQQSVRANSDFILNEQQKNDSAPDFGPKTLQRNRSTQDLIHQGYREDFPVRYTSSPEQEDNEPHRPNFLSESGDEMMFLIESKPQDTQEMGNYNVKHNNNKSELSIQRHVEQPRTADISTPNPIEEAVNFQKSPNNLQDVSMPSFRMLNSINDNIESTQLDLMKEDNLKISNPNLADEKGGNLVPITSKPDSTLKSSQSLDFQPPKYSTPISKFPESKLQQKNLSTLYENEDQEDAISEKSVSLGNQKDNSNNSDEFW